MQIQVSTHDWLKLPHEVRQRLASTFDIPRSQGTTVIGNQVQSDGYTHQDLSTLTVEKMQAYLQSESTDFIELFNETVQKIMDELVVVEEKPQIDPKQLLLEEWTRVLIRIKNESAEADLYYPLQEAVSRVFDFRKVTTQPNVPQTTKKGRKAK